MTLSRAPNYVSVSDLSERQTFKLHAILTDTNPNNDLFNIQQILMVLHGFGYTVELCFTSYHEPNWKISDDTENQRINVGVFDSASLYSAFVGGETFVVGIPKRVQEKIGYLDDSRPFTRK